MKPINIVLFAVIIAVLGNWAADKKLDQRQVVGGVVVLFMFMFISTAQPKLAQNFSWLILASTVGAYGKDLFGTVGKVTGATASGVAAAGKAVTPKAGN